MPLTNTLYDSMEVGGAITDGFPDGTAPAPSIYFVSDTNTGLFRPGADCIGLVTGGVSRITLANDWTDLTNDLRFSPDNTQNIGEVAGFRPKDVYIGSYLQVGTNANIGLDLNVGDALDVQGQTYLRSGSVHYGPLEFNPDNTHDIGLFQSPNYLSRPRNVYVGTSVRTPLVTAPATLVLTPDGHVVEQRNGQNVQTLRIYGTYTDASNWRRLSIGEAAGNFVIASEVLGLAGGRSIDIRSLANVSVYAADGNNVDLFAGLHMLRLSYDGRLYFGADNVIDIGSAVNGYRPRNGYFAGAVGTKVKAGPITDADVVSPVNGMLAVDNTNKRLYVRAQNVWTTVLLDGSSLWFTGVGPPSAGIGKPGDMYLESDGDIWQNVGGTWTSTGINIMGPQGVQGVQGVTGPTGATGPQGPQGAQGPAGTGLTLLGNVNTAANLPAQPQPQGDAYVALDTGHIWVSSGGVWLDVGPFVGPKGEQGPLGPVGATGPTGPQGVQGVPGTPGSTGAQGPAGPQGIEGPRGPQGIPGDPYGTPALAVGSMVHWRPYRETKQHYALCKPAVVLGVWDEYYNLLTVHVLGTEGGPAELRDKVQTGHGEGQWHFIPDCPYSFLMNQQQAFVPQAVIPARANGHITFPPASQVLVTGGTP